MADEPTYRAGKPTLTVHPVIGRDALRFPIEPTPPAAWWIGLRRYATADQLLTRPWDEPAHNTLTIECPDAASLATVIEAVDHVIDKANRDYADQLAAGVVAQERFQAETTRRQHERETIIREINDRYDQDTT
jgi:hypothetical protein